MKMSVTNRLVFVIKYDDGTYVGPKGERDVFNPVRVPFYRARLFTRRTFADQCIKQSGLTDARIVELDLVDA